MRTREHGVPREIAMAKAINSAVGSNPDVSVAVLQDTERAVSSQTLFCIEFLNGRPESVQLQTRQLSLRSEAPDSLASIFIGLPETPIAIEEADFRGTCPR